MDQVYYESKEIVTKNTQKAYAEVVQLDLANRLDAFKQKNNDFFYRDLTCKDNVSYTVSCSAHIGYSLHNRVSHGKDISEISSDIIIYGANLITQTKVGFYDFENTKFKLIFENINLGDICSNTMEISYISHNGDANIGSKGFCIKDNSERFSADMDIDISLKNDYLRNIFASKPRAFEDFMENTFIKSINLNLYAPMGLVKNRIFNNLLIFRDKLTKQAYSKIENFNRNGGSINITLKPLKSNTTLMSMLHDKSQPVPKLFDIFDIAVD